VRVFGVVRRIAAGFSLEVWISKQYIQRMTRTNVFLSNKSQAVRLPKDVAFPAAVREVAILKDGLRRVIVPATAVWDDFFDAPGIDLGERTEPLPQEREAF
jgi:antitoxin VapB